MVVKANSLLIRGSRNMKGACLPTLPMSTPCMIGLPGRMESKSIVPQWCCGQCDMDLGLRRTDSDGLQHDGVNFHQFFVFLLFLILLFLVQKNLLLEQAQ